MQSGPPEGGAGRPVEERALAEAVFLPDGGEAGDLCGRACGVERVGTDVPGHVRVGVDRGQRCGVLLREGRHDQSLALEVHARTVAGDGRRRDRVKALRASVDRLLTWGFGPRAHALVRRGLLAWIHGGETSLENSALLCERHHTKVHHGFRVERQPDGRWRTRRPDGTEIRTGPHLTEPLPAAA